MYNLRLNSFRVNFKLINDLTISCHRKLLRTKLKYAPPPRRLPALDMLLFANIIECADLEKGFRLPPTPTPERFTKLQIRTCLEYNTNDMIHVTFF